MAAAALACGGAGLAAAQETPTTTAGQAPGVKYELVGQVVSADRAAQTITIRLASRRQDGTERHESTSAPPSAPAAASAPSRTGPVAATAAAEAGTDGLTLSVTGKAVGQLSRYKAGQTGTAAGQTNTIGQTAQMAPSDNMPGGFRSWVSVHCPVVTDIGGTLDPAAPRR